MAMDPVQAVIFDMGGTLENLTYDDSLRQEATRDLRQVLLGLALDPGLSLPDLQAVVLSGLRAYQAWREQSEVELPPEKVWTEYIFANHDVCRERLVEAADDLALFYETHFYTRSLRPEALAALETLRERGFRLAIISNTLSRSLVPRKLVEYGIADYFDPVVTSASLGWRKPNERIFAEATRLLQLPPQACIYVGDTVSRDVVGARRAGYGSVLQIESFLTARSDRGVGHMSPDAVIRDLSEVVEFVTLAKKAIDGD